MKRVNKLTLILAYLFLMALLAIAKEETDKKGGPGPRGPSSGDPKGPDPGYGRSKGPGPYGPGPEKPGPYGPGKPWPYGPGPRGPGPYGPDYGPWPYGPGFGCPGYGGWPGFGRYPGYGGHPCLLETPTGTENKMSNVADLNKMFEEAFKTDVMSGYEHP